MAAEPEPGVAAAQPAPEAERILTVDAAPVAAKPAEPEPVAEQIPAVEAAPVVETAVAPQPVAEEIPHVEAAPVEEAAAEPEPVAEHVPPVEAEPVVEEIPHVEAAPVAEAVAEPKPVAEHVPQVEAEPVAAKILHVEAAPVAEAVAEPEPVAEHVPPVEAVAVEPEVPAAEAEVPDPLFALAVEIRAVQAARAASQDDTEQPDSSGLLELAGVVGVQPAPIQHSEAVEAVEPVAAAAPASAPDLVPATETVVAAVALLAAAEPEPLPPPQPVALAHTGPEGPTLPFAPMQDYTPATSRSILPVPPRQEILAADSGPRITLPGPTLPPELTRLQDANVVTVIGEQTAQRTMEALPPAKAPGWLVSALVMIVMLAAGLAVVYFLLLPRTVADAKPAPTPAAAATGPAPTSGNSPLAKFVEVTGFRIVTSPGDPARKSEVQYLVVNHSDADISDANVFITLRSAKPGQAPLCRFSFKVPSLGPFEAKEMASPIEKTARGISLPDWQDVRADVQIGQ